MDENIYLYMWQTSICINIYACSYFNDRVFWFGPIWRFHVGGIYLFYWRMEWGGLGVFGWFGGCL